MVEEKWVCEGSEDYGEVSAVTVIAAARARDTSRRGWSGWAEEVVEGGGGGGEGGRRAHTSARASEHR